MRVYSDVSDVSSGRLIDFPIDSCGQILSCRQEEKLANRSHHITSPQSRVAVIAKPSGGQSGREREVDAAESSKRDQVAAALNKLIFHCE